MVEIKRRDNDRGRSGSVSAVSTIQSKKKILFGIVFVVIILLIGVVFFINKFSAVGQAVHTQQQQAPSEIPVGINAVVWTDFLNATVAEGDIIHIPIHLKTDGGVKVDKFTFKILYNTNLFSLDAVALGTSNLPKAFGGFQFMGSPQDVLNDIIGGQNVDMVALSSFTGDQVIVDIAFKVIGKANAQLTPGVSSIMLFKFISAGYLDSNSNPVVVKLFPEFMELNITIYPACQDADGDGYVVSGTDNRGCVHNLPTDIDCDDISSDDPEICKSGLNCNDVTYAGCAKCIYPGAQEVCDGINNDCSSVIDDSVGNGAYNDKLQGVCYGYKICMGKDGWKNSYEVNDKTLNTQSFIGGNMKYNQLDLYVSPIVDASTGKVTGPGVEKCDVFDNNCDGKVNEGITCSLSGGGGIPKGLLPVGNVFVDYDYEDNLDEQKINFFDIAILPDYKQVLNNDNYGDENLKQLPATFYAFGTIGWICDKGYYYSTSNKGQTIYFNKYDGARVLEEGFSIGVGDILLNKGGSPVKCGDN